MKVSAPIYRTTPRRGPADTRFWDATILTLLRSGNSFLPIQFSAQGYLFRGLRSGLSETLERGRAGHFSAVHSLGELEKRLDVYFVSNVPSDALGVAGLERDYADTGIVVFPARIFNEALAHGQAGVLAFAEGGLVFKYPFLCQAPALAEAAYLLVNDAGRDRIASDPHLCSRWAALRRNGLELITLESHSESADARRNSRLQPKLPPCISGAAFERSALKPSAGLEMSPNDCFR